MTQAAAITLMIGAALVLLAFGVWAWRRRIRRDGALPAPVGELPDRAVVLSRFTGLYVATTAHDEPLERLAVRGLAYRSRVDIVVADAGVALDLTGRPRLFVPSARIVAVTQATVAIDRVVERDGLTRLSWRIDGDRIVDSYFRPQDASARALADAIRPLIPDDVRASQTQPGADA